MACSAIFLVSTHICDSEWVRRQSNTSSADADLSSQGEARRAWGVQWPTCQPQVSVKNTYSSLCARVLHARVLHACPAKGGFPDALATNTQTKKPQFSRRLSATPGTKLRIPLCSPVILLKVARSIESKTTSQHFHTSVWFLKGSGRTELGRGHRGASNFRVSV